MKAYDCISLIKMFENIPFGTKGIILFQYDETTFEVELFDDDGKTISICTIDISYIDNLTIYKSLCA